MNIQYAIGNGFGYRERSQFMGVDAYFDPRIKNRSHATPKYEPVKSNFEIDYYGQMCCSPEKLACIRGMLKKSGQEVMYFSKSFD